MVSRQGKPADGQPTCQLRSGERSEPNQPFPAKGAPPKNENNVPRIQQAFLRKWTPNTLVSSMVRTLRKRSGSPIKTYLYSVTSFRLPFSRGAQGAEIPAASIMRDKRQRASAMDWSPRGRVSASLRTSTSNKRFHCYSQSCSAPYEEL